MSWTQTTRRRVVQTVSLALLNANFYGSDWGARFCLPVMNCEACAVSWLGCPIGMIGRSVGFLEFPLLVVLIVLGIGLLAGRMLCGWVCPMGFLQDLLFKLRSRKIRLPRYSAWLKYVVLVFFVFIVARFMGYDSPLFFCKFCPTAGLQVVLPLMVSGNEWLLSGERAIKMSIVVAVLILAVLNHRSFCKLLCPVGALIAITNRFSLFRLKLDSKSCISCRKCDRACPMDVPVMSHRASGRSVSRRLECIDCLTCQQVCPVRAIDNNAPLLRNPGTVKSDSHRQEAP